MEDRETGAVDFFTELPFRDTMALSRTLAVLRARPFSTTQPEPQSGPLWAFRTLRLFHVAVAPGDPTLIPNREAGTLILNQVSFSTPFSSLTLASESTSSCQYVWTVRLNTVAGQTQIIRSLRSEDGLHDKKPRFSACPRPSATFSRRMKRNARSTSLGTPRRAAKKKDRTY